MDFFPEPTPQSAEEEPQPYALPAWTAAPDDIMPGVVPLELVLGRSAGAVVFLTGIRAFPTGLAMSLGVRVRGSIRSRDLNDEIFDCDPGVGGWGAGRLKWGFELADGRRVTNVDRQAHLDLPNRDHQRPHHPDDAAWEPARPILNGGGGGGGRRSVDRDYWLWPLPPAGRLRVVCQWPDQGIGRIGHDLDAQPFLDAASRAQPLWPPS